MGDFREAGTRDHGSRIPPGGFIAAGKLHASILPIRLDHIAALQTLPFLHQDPFDRMLIAQALAAKATLVTNDDAIPRYGAVPVLSL
jgi:PIN domain nuclease of toxin-antitoxin system